VQKADAGAHAASGEGNYGAISQAEAARAIADGVTKLVSMRDYGAYVEDSIGPGIIGVEFGQGGRNTLLDIKLQETLYLRLRAVMSLRACRQRKPWSVVSQNPVKRSWPDRPCYLLLHVRKVCCRAQ